MSTTATIIPSTKYAFARADFGASGPPPASANPSQYLEVDVTISEKVTRSAELTSNPVEQGVDVVDHKRPKPIVLEMSGIMVDDLAIAPMAGPPSALAGTPGFFSTALSKLNPYPRDPRLPDVQVVQATSSRAQAGYDALKALFANREPLQIVTSREVYQSMMITDLVVSRNDAGLAMAFQATMQEFRYATTSAIPFVATAVAAQTSTPAKAVVEAEPILPEGTLLKRGLPVIQEGIDKAKAFLGIGG